MRLLFLCNTLYQIIAASCIRKMYSDYPADIILSDHSVAGKELCGTLQKNGLIFNNAYYVESKHLYEYDDSLSRVQRFSDYRSCNTLLSHLKLEEPYDAFFCANAEPFSERLATYIKRTNAAATINWFEDGLSAYNSDQLYFPKGWQKIRDILKKKFGVYRITCSLDGYYVFRPENMEWTPPAEVKRIEPMDQALAGELARLFDFANCPDTYSEKYIFLEDGARDWNNPTDVEYVQKIADVVGKENILVKIHPRNPVNRFAQLGFKTNQDLSIPWEVIAPNIGIENKVLITMFSQSVITPYILSGRMGKALVLGKIDKGDTSTILRGLDFMDRKFFKVFPDKFFVPESEMEFEEYLAHLQEK